jgi:2-aminoadipate transaminase
VSVLPAPGVISFARGIPAPEMFPAVELAEASRRAFERHSATALNYGAPGGFEPLREWLADRHGTSPDRIIIGPGSCLLLGLLVRAQVSMPRPVLVESPTYDRMNLMLQRAGAQVVAVDRGPEGLDLDGLESWLDHGERPAFLYVMPTLHNPTGTSMSMADRERLADLAVRYGLLVVEDDPYGLLQVDGPALPSLRDALDARGAGHLAVFISSFSKIVAPGLRVGYAVLPPALVDPVGALALETYVSPPLWPQAELYEFLAAGFLPPHLDRVRALLRARRDALMERLAAGLDGLARWTTPAGGYFTWLELPDDVRAADLLVDCESDGVSFVPGTGFFLGTGGEHAARLSFSYPDVADIRAGADRLVAAVQRRLASVGVR